jgi:hypothetical protein
MAMAGNLCNREMEGLLRVLYRSETDGDGQKSPFKRLKVSCSTG